MRSLARSLIGRRRWTIHRRFAGTLMCVLSVVSCGDTAARSAVAPTTTIVETATPVATLPASSSTDVTESAEQRCTHFAPNDQPMFLKAQTVTISDIRNIVVATLPPTPTSLLLPERAASEEALMCWSTLSTESPSRSLGRGRGSVAGVLHRKVLGGRLTRESWRGRHVPMRPSRTADLLTLGEHHARGDGTTAGAAKSLLSMTIEARSCGRSDSKYKRHPSR